MAAEAALASAPARGHWLRRAGLLLGIALAVPLAAQPLGDRELQVEAAFLVNFVRYAEWPPERFDGPGDPYVIGVVGTETASDNVAGVARAPGPIQGRRIEVKRVALEGRPGSAERRAAIRRLRDCHLAFLPGSADTGTREFLDALEGAQVLTVGDAPGFVASGGMIGLVRAGPHIAFEANPQAIQDSGVGLSAKVLKLARIRGDRR